MKGARHRQLYRTCRSHGPVEPTVMTFTPEDQDGLASPTDTDRVDSTVSTLGIRGRQFPQHPIAQLQGPFEESILEADEEGGDQWVVELDAQARRRDLLEKSEYERLCGRKWRQRPGERQAVADN